MHFDGTLASFVLALFCAVYGWFSAWKARIEIDKQKAALNAKEEYAQQRDMQHLIGNIKQLSSGVTQGFDHIENEVNDLKIQIIEIKAYLIQQK